MTWRVAAFYRFFPVDDPAALCRRLEKAARQYGDTCGTILVAEEGINATIAGRPGSIEPIVAAILNLLGDNIKVKWSLAQTAPFRRLRIRVRPEIITFGEPGANPAKRTARAVDATEWRQLLERDDVLVLDVRNDYEIHAGRFRAARSPDTESFTDFSHFIEQQLVGHEQQPIAMYCTGGIRCEKASSLLLERGFEQVTQLEGGVLGYFEQVQEHHRQVETNDSPDSQRLRELSRQDESWWQGECFVFDSRTSVGPDLTPGSALTCRQCGWPVMAEEQNDPRFVPDKSCPHCSEIASADFESPR